MADIIRVGMVIDDGGAQGAISRTVVGLNRLASAADSNTMGMRKVQGALAAFSYQAIGMAGPMGQLASSFLAFGPGGIISVGFVAGFTAMSVAMKMLGLAAEESEERIGKLLEEAQKLGRAPDADLLVQQLGLQTTINLSKKALGPNATRSDVQALGFASGMLDDGVRGVIKDRLATAEAGLITVTAKLTEVRFGQIRAAIKDTGVGFDVTPGDRALLNGPLGFAAFGAGRGLALPAFGSGQMTPSALSIERILELQDQMFQGEGAIRTQKGGRFGVGQGLGVAAGGLGMLAGTLGRGNAGGSFLQGAGGLLGSIPGGQVAGGVVGILGGIVSLFGHKESAEEKQLKELEKVNASLREQLEFARREELRQLTIRVRSGALGDPRSADALARLARDAKDRKITVDFG